MANANLPPMIKLKDGDRFAVRVGFGRSAHEWKGLVEGSAFATANEVARRSGRIARVHVVTHPGEPLVAMYVPERPGYQGRAVRFMAREIAAGGGGALAMAEWKALPPEQRGESSVGIFVGK